MAIMELAGSQKKKKRKKNKTGLPSFNWRDCPSLCCFMQMKTQTAEEEFKTRSIKNRK